MNSKKTLTPQQVTEHLDRYFQKIQLKQPSRPLQVQVFCEGANLDYGFPADSANRPFHIASVGKLFTAALVYRLAERKALNLRDPLSNFFSPSELERLFVYRGVDYADRANAAHLLAHTSGIADYFEGRASGGKSFTDDLLAQPQKHWTPQMLIDYSRDHQAAVGYPGKTFSYSDTGYILLGQIVEKIAGKPFHQALADEIFNPLEMRDSYLMFYSRPLNTPGPPIEKIWFNKVEVSGFESLSCDWAGGGIVSTPADLLKFSRALRGGGLLSGRTLEAMDDCKHKFRSGIYYGSGMMEIRFGAFFFLLRKLPRVKGHIGVLATHLFYDPAHAAHIVLNFGDTARMVDSFKALIEIENTLLKLS